MQDARFLFRLVKKHGNGIGVFFVNISPFPDFAGDF